LEEAEEMLVHLKK